MASAQAVGTESVKTTRQRTNPYQVVFRVIELCTQLCFHITRFLFRITANKLRRQHRSGKALLGQSIAELCDSLGATFIKIGQILSTRYDLFPLEMIVPLTRLQDHIRPFPFRFVPAIIKGETGYSLPEIFAEFEEIPLSSASIACVYRARLHNGQQVAVKIRRPDIVRKVHNDLHLMRFMSLIIARLPPMRLVPVVEMVNDLGQCIEQQLDLRTEAQNTRRFRERLAAYERVQIPALVEEYCSEAVLVMEFMEDLVRIDALDWTEAEYQEALITGLRALYHMIFADGFFHCDLHPGNLYLRKGGRVVILDTGFISRLERNNRFQFAEFFLGIATNQGKKCARIIYETALLKPDIFDQDGFDEAIVTLIDRSAGSSAEAFQVASFAVQLFDIQRRFGLRSSTDFTMAILALLVFEGIAKQLYPRLDFQLEARPFLIDAMLEKRAEVASPA